METERAEALQGRLEALMHTITALITRLDPLTAAGAALDLTVALDIALEDAPDEPEGTRASREALGRAYAELLRSVAGRA